MRFLMIPTAIPGSPSHPEQPFDEAYFTAAMKFNEDLHRAGVLVASEGVLPGAVSAHVKTIQGKRTVVDGPFAETKELLAGFWLIEVGSRAEAIEWAVRSPINPAADEVIELRQLTGASDIPPELVKLAEKAAPAWASSWTSQQKKTK